MPLNIDLWNHSLEMGEEILDPHYFVAVENFVISDTSNFHGEKANVTSAITVENKVNELISKIADQINNNINYIIHDKEIEELRNLMLSDFSNLTTFRSFWPVLDMNSSVFTSLNVIQQKEFLEQAAISFIKNRHGLYSSVGYSPISLQILSDANAHKGQGSMASNKLAKIFLMVGLIEAVNWTDFFNHSGTFALMGRSISDSELDLLCKKLNIDFEWRKGRQNKKPDFFLHIGSEIYFGEAKHKKEGGGGQNDQVNEIIDFISFTEASQQFGYISFLDGVYFNKFSEPMIGKKINKTQNQKRKIEHLLALNTNNYFLNTAGIEKFLKVKLNLTTSD